MLVVVVGCGPEKGRWATNEEGITLFPSDFQKAVKHGMKLDGDLSDELSNLGDYPISSGRDARAICKALAKLPADGGAGSGSSSRLHVLTGLFQDVASPESKAFRILRSDGQAHLVRIFDALIEHPSEDEADDLLFVLKVLAMYQSPDAAERIVRAARRPLKADGYLWHMIFSILDHEHPHRNMIFEALTDPLPPGFIAVALLDSANGSAIAGRLERHPFDSTSGKEQLTHWLTSEDPDDFSSAHSATASLPFIGGPDRDRLLAVAANHPEASVQIEAAWAAATLGNESGMATLARFCIDPNHSATAQRYLEELGQEDAIPDEALDPGFLAKAELAQWLTHPNELGRPPDEIEVVDSRTLQWPPDGERRQLWLIRYRVRDTTGLEDDDVDVAMVGSVTFCLFSYGMSQRPPEDVYAIHCYWEMEGLDLIDEQKPDRPGEYASMLGQWLGEALAEPEIRWVATLAADLEYPQEVVAMATAKRLGKQGWVVLDGPRSTWYAADDLPAETFESTVLKMHVGRALLGFTDQPDRPAFLRPKAPARDPELLVDAYGQLLNEARSGDDHRRRELLTATGSPLAQHFEAYVEARSELMGLPRARAFIELYGLLLEIVAAADPSIAEDAYDTFGPLGEHFDGYVDALGETGAAAEIAAAIEPFAPRWQHNLGYGRLGRAAFTGGDDAMAERFINELRQSDKHWYRAGEMSILARIQHRTGQEEQARELLGECLERLASEAGTATGSDRDLFEGWFQHHRSTFLELFPNGEDRLQSRGIPSSTLQ